MAFQAGMDVLLSTQQDQGEVVRGAIYDGIKNGDIDQDAFDASTARVAKMRSGLSS